MGNLSHEYRLELRISNTHCPIRGDLEEIIRKIMIIITTIIYWVPMVETVLKTLHMLFAVKKRSKSGSYETYHPSSMKSSQISQKDPFSLFWNPVQVIISISQITVMVKSLEFAH